MSHRQINWNPGNKQWFCTSCARTFDGASAQDARDALDKFDCQLPYVETPQVMPGEETVSLIKKPFKMELKK
jgi:hypothetical protein